MADNQAGGVAILGVFVADVAFRAGRQPNMGETLIGSQFTLGPGGKGSNQAVAAARLGSAVTFISKLGKDAFADLALDTWRAEGVRTAVTQVDDDYTGAAYIFIEDGTGENAIIVCPGAAMTISADLVENARDAIVNADVFITQLEQPVEAARRGLEIARNAGVATILNPAPAAAPIDAAIFPLCDFVTPNESETEGLTGLAVTNVEEARRAADAFLEMGVGTALITLGEGGALFHSHTVSELVPACRVAPVVETTGAGDAFNGGFATALARGLEPLEAARFGCAVAGISVTRPGTAPSMPSLEEAEKVFRS